MSASSPRRKKTERAEAQKPPSEPVEKWQRIAERHAAADETVRRRAPQRKNAHAQKPRARSSVSRPAEKPVHYIIQNLERAYGLPVNKWGDWDPLDMLIATVLSQATSDVNSDRTWDALKRRFPVWEDVLRARETTLAETIREGGLANQKARVIRDILRQLKARTGALTLNFLRDYSTEEAARFLSAFRGIGPKTVACTLLFSCDKEIFPLDTHIFRILRRVGLIPEKCSDARAHEIMNAQVPAGKFYSFHVNLIRHGRKLCRPREPLCADCPIVEYCDYGQVLI